MASILEKLRKKQAGYNAARKAIEETAPKTVEIEKTDGKETRITVSYEPAYDTFAFKIHGNNSRYGEYFRGIGFIDAKLILEALNEFFMEAADAS